MRGVPNANREAFEYWAQVLRDKGHEVFSPPEFSAKLFGPDRLESEVGQFDAHGRDALTVSRTVFAIDLMWITQHADAVATIPGWRAGYGRPESRGTAAEIAVANALPIPVFDVRDFE